MPDDNRPWEPERFLASNAVCEFCNRFVIPDKQRWTWLIVGEDPDTLLFSPIHTACLDQSGWELRLPDSSR